jgi:hypothetical protein
VRRLGALAALALTACGKLQNFGGVAPPLAAFQVTFTGDVAQLRPPGATQDLDLRLALVWGAQWLTEPFCVLPAESDDAAAVITAGCRDPFGFVPLPPSISVPLAPDGPTALVLNELPGADVMVGDITARVAYGSLVVFDDGNHDGTLELSRPNRTPIGNDSPGGGNTTDSPDIIYGASFVTMSAPDRRVAYREGRFDEKSAFYPRAGCPDPRRGFSIVGADGFTREAGIASAAAGELPAEDPAGCFAAVPEATTVEIVARAPTEVAEVACDERRDDGSVRYNEPPTAAPNLAGRVTACTHLPTADAGGQSSLIQMVVSGATTDRCMSLTHYVLRGCRNGLSCSGLDHKWDMTASPPLWWPCPY